MIAVFAIVGLVLAGLAGLVIYLERQERALIEELDDWSKEEDGE